MATTSSGTITSTTSNGTTRITGLSSGIDVDSMVKQLMDAEKSKLNRLKQNQQLAEWRQEAYQTITDKITTFADTYFSLTSSSSLIRTTTYSQYKVTSDSSAVTVSAATTATAGTHTVSVSSLATAATLKSGTQSIQGDSAADYTTAQGTSLTITLDGTAYTVNLDSSVTDAAALQDAIDNAVGEGKLVVSEDSGVLSLKSADDSGVYSVTLTGADALTALGLGDGSETSVTNVLDIDTTTLSDLLSADSFDGDGQIAVSINNVSIYLDADDTVDDVISKINDSDAGVTMKYNSLTNGLVLTADTLGAGTTIVTSDSAFFTTLLGTATAGTDTKVTVDGTAYSLTSNKITVDGVTYTFNKVTDENAVVTVERDTDSIYDTITGFVDDYNALIEEINAELAEDYDYDYPPLTDAQKEEMTDDEIEKWEEKAKTGLLETDSTLRKMLANLREAIMDPVTGVSTYFTDETNSTSWGLFYSSDYTEKGKLSYNADELKAALEDPDTLNEIMNMFAQKSTSYADNSKVRDLSSSARAVRYKEEGIAYRFYDILQDNIGTTKNSAGNYGLLIEKAGSSKTTYDNTLTELLEDYQEKIDAEEERLDDKEDYYYNKYTNMETYLNNLNSQYESFLSILGDDS